MTHAVHFVILGYSACCSACYFASHVMFLCCSLRWKLQRAWKLGAARQEFSTCRSSLESKVSISTHAALSKDPCINTDPSAIMLNQLVEGV